MHTPIIDEETFNIVQDMLKSRTGVRTKSYDWLLKGLICCKECGKKLSVLPHKQKTKTVFYLRCNTYANNTNLGLCTPHCNNLDVVTDLVIAQIKEKCKLFLEKEKYTKIANVSKDRIMKDKFNVKNEDSSIDINKIVNDFISMKEITRTMIVSLVDKIEISENKEITIYYKFNILNMNNVSDLEKNGLNKKVS